MRLVLDTVGGDHGVSAAVEGAVLASKSGDIGADEITLVGDPAAIRGELTRLGASEAGFVIVDAPDVVPSDATPIEALRKHPRNSIAVCVGQVKEGGADAMVSAGSTGLVVASAALGLRCLEGVRRPGIAVTIRGEHGAFTVIDVGANPQPKAVDLLQYAIMGSAHAHDSLGIVEPRVGLMNIGSEDQKGNPVVKEARDLLGRHDVNFRFVGNVEGSDVFTGACDVIVCDGFTGNVLLKVSEGCAEYMLRLMGRSFVQEGIEADARERVIQRMQADVDFSEYGGALLLGVEGTVTICHGRSRAPALANAIRFAARAVGARVNEHITTAIASASTPST